MIQLNGDDATWYEATAKREVASAPLLEQIKADVCVVACGASGRNGGFVSNGFALGIDDVATQVGADAARGLYALSKLGTEYVRGEVAATDKMGDGWMVAVRHNDGGGLHRYGEGLASGFGEEMQLLSVVETRVRLNSERYFQGVHFPKAFHIHPLRYALSLADKARKLGAQIFEHSAVLTVEKVGASFLLNTAQGQVTAQHVVHCVSSTGRSVHKRSGRAVLPVATYVAVTEPLQQNAINTSAAISDTRRAGDYYRLIDEGRILWGGRITTKVAKPSHLAERMKGDMLSTYPTLGNPRIDYAWAGLMGYAIHKMPLIGRDAEGQWFGTAFGGHGLNTTAMAGVILARAIAEGDDAYRQFAPYAPKWAYGQLGRLGVQGSYWMMQLRDKLDESRRVS
jgi:gamma-glutamylputrescine oxidase